MTDKLLPCPFCGGEARIKSRYIGYGSVGLGARDWYTVECNECRVKSDEYGAELEAIAAWNRRAEPEDKPLTRCENCTHWDKSISFMMSAHACSYWSPSKRSPRYTEGFEFCSFASAKPERSEGNEVRSD